jgi:hypothetical protein
LQSLCGVGLLFDLVITSQDLHRPVDFIVRDIDNCCKRGAIKLRRRPNKVAVRPQRSEFALRILNTAAIEERKIIGSDQPMPCDMREESD